MASVLLGLGLLYFFSHALSLSFARTRVPDVLLLMVVGILVGPGSHTVEVDAFGKVGMVLTTIALAAILFQSGTELDLRSVTASANATTRLTFVSAGLTLALAAPLGVWLGGLDWLPALVLGAILSGTSSAVVIPMVKSLRMRDEPATVLVLESALTDVLCIVATFGLLQAAAQGTVDVVKVVGQTVSSMLFAALLGAAGGVGWLRVWSAVRALPDTNFSTIAGALVLYGVAEGLGFSGPIGVLSFGLTLRNHQALGLARFVRAESDQQTITVEEQRFYREVVFLLKTFFFVYLGISMGFRDQQALGIAGAIVVAVYLARLITVGQLLPRSYPRRDVAVMAVMVPKGLAAAVLAALPLRMGIAGGALIQDIVYSVVLVSITVTALAVALFSTRPGQVLVDRLFGRFAPDGDPAPG